MTPLHFVSRGHTRLRPEPVLSAAEVGFAGQALRVFICTALCVAPVLTIAQSSAPVADSVVQAVVTGPTDVAVGRTIVLDASASRIGDGTVERYAWTVDGQRTVISQTVEAVYTPEKPGDVVFNLAMTVRLPSGERVQSETQYRVIAYARKIVLIADPGIEREKLSLHMETAKEQGIFLRIVQPVPSTTPLDAEESLVNLLTEDAAALQNADAVVVWTEGVRGLQALMRVSQSNPDLRTSIAQQTIVVIADGSLNTLSRTAKGQYSVLHPQAILLTRREALNALLATPSLEEFLSEIQRRDIDILRLDASSVGLRPWNVLSTLTNAMLVRGVPSQTVILLLVLPVIATILAFLKQVIGITTFGLYTPSIIALSFLALGWQMGVLFLVAILFVGYAARRLMHGWRILYIPKVAIVLTVVSIALLVLMSVGAMMGLTFTRETIFLLLIMSTLSESFLNLKTEQGMLTAVLGVGETVLAALLCVFLVQWGPFQSLLLAYPELLIFTVLANILLGRWTGLRLVEYFRFRDVFRHLQEE